LALLNLIYGLSSRLQILPAKRTYEQHLGHKSVGTLTALPVAWMKSRRPCGSARGGLLSDSSSFSGNCLETPLRPKSSDNSRDPVRRFQPTTARRAAVARGANTSPN